MHILPYTNSTGFQAIVEHTPFILFISTKIQEKGGGGGSLTIYIGPSKKSISLISRGYVF